MIPKIFDSNPDSYDIFTNFINAYRLSTVNKVNINELVNLLIKLNLQEN